MGSITKENPQGVSARNRFARELFSPIAKNYEVWSKILSFGRDPAWRKAMVRGLGLETGSMVLDVAAGTGLVARLLERSGFRAVAVDQSPDMLRQAARRNATAVNARAESLPFRDNSFDGLTFTYLLRYVENPLDCMRELVRVVRPGGKIGMVEFGRPFGVWKWPWRLYTRIGLPAAGALIAPGWREVGLFLGKSIDEFHDRFPGKSLTSIWERAGLTKLRSSRPSLGGGLLMWGVKA